MKKIISKILLAASICGLTGCGENKTEIATEIKDLVATYEANIDNADFSKFTLTDSYISHSEYNVNDYTSDKSKDLVVSYDESGYLYYKNYNYVKEIGESGGYTSHFETWLYIDDNNLILATISSSNKKTYDVLEFDSYEDAQARFLEEVPKCLDDFGDWFWYQNNTVYEIPKKYCLDNYLLVTRACERQINNDENEIINVTAKDETVLALTVEGDTKYSFENGIFKSYEAKYDGTTKKTASNGIEWVEDYESEYNKNLSLTSDLNKPDLSTFDKVWH